MTDVLHAPYHRRDAHFTPGSRRQSPPTPQPRVPYSFNSRPDTSLPDSFSVGNNPSSSPEFSTVVAASPELPYTSFPTYAPASVKSPALPSFLTTPDFDDTDDFFLPAYDVGCDIITEEKTPKLSTQPQPPSESDTEETACDFSMMPRTAGDDNSIESEPTRHVDYLAHDWEEEDIWSSWRYVVSKRTAYNNSTRLENAAWRSWAKCKYQLGTVPPESLDWLKDCDVTWLYGPLQTRTKPPSSDTSPPPSGIPTTGPFLDKKPILKKRTASQAILQRSLSTHTLLKHAGAIVKAQEADSPHTRPNMYRSASDFAAAESMLERLSVGSTLGSTLASETDSPSERRHISFNTEVVQCIALDGDEDRGGYHFDYPYEVFEDKFSDDGVFMLKQMASRPRLSNLSTPRGSFSSDSKTIAPLPSTTLKCLEDDLQPEEPKPRQAMFPLSWLPRLPGLVRAPSNETLRPQSRGSSTLLGDNDNDYSTPTLEIDANWHSSLKESLTDEPVQNNTNTNTSWFSGQIIDQQRPNYYTSFSDPIISLDFGDSDSDRANDNEEEESIDEVTDYGLIGKVLDTVNTAKDIAHVIWNVGWRN
ncbi:hypothetical protein AJ80_06966 [Polytolypa hystricis UAMH7299]|uniref:Nitrogen regulatory protein areA GATA-like domain-containing protein n=1 Tax=Polytolypa hystricis (strain UAMH7299) TaxID=1447883 RepID=A0A2B7XT92_POLH7|nr:hypothetical protein AJ80_06966 [Polytolypa hystricis UAMH7299]